MDWLWIFPVLFLLVVIHELGHFVSARVLGIRVEEFGVGFPPRLFAIKRNGIEYSLNMLPIGGFVRILGENGDSQAPDSFAVQPAWKRIIVLSAGVIMNLLLALLIYTVVVDNSPVGFSQVDKDSPAGIAHLQPNDLLLAVNGTAVGDVNDARDKLNSHLGQPVSLLISRNGQQMAVPVTLRPTTPALGVGLTEAVDPVRVAYVRPGGPAAAAGLRVGDVITAVNGQPATTNIAIMQALKSAPGNVITLTVKRNGVPVQLTGSPASWSFDEWHFVAPFEWAVPSPAAIGRGFARAGESMRAIPEGLVTVIRGLLAGQSQAGAVAGPVGIAQITGEVASEQGLGGLAQLTALLSINLFLFNLLPWPALDGGRLLFILIELLRGGRKMAPEREGLVNLVGMSVLLLLMLVITFFDVQNILQGNSILGR